MSGRLIRDQRLRIEDLERYIMHLEAEVARLKGLLNETESAQSSTPARRSA